MLDKLLSIKSQQQKADVFAVVNSQMDLAVAVDLLISVFGQEQCKALAKTLTAELKRRRALETTQAQRVATVRRKVAKNAN